MVRLASDDRRRRALGVRCHCRKTCSYPIEFACSFTYPLGRGTRKGHGTMLRCTRGGEAWAHLHGVEVPL